MKRFVTPFAALITIALLTFASVNTQAEVITLASWNLGGEPGNQTSTVGVGVTNVTALNVTRGSGIGVTAATNSISSNGWNTLNPAEDYFSFGFNVAEGYQVSLDTLYIGTRASGTGPGDLGLFYSGDNFSTNLFTFTQDNTNFLNSVIDLAALDGLTGEVEFRIIALSDTRADGNTNLSITSTGTYRITNYFDGGDTGSFNFTGTVSLVPEPASVMLLLAGGAILLARRR